MPVINIDNGRIREVSSERGTTFVTVTYRERSGQRWNEQTVRLVVGPQTIILNDNGRRVSENQLSRGMIIDATASSAMTRSIPPQTNAYVIRIVRRGQADNFTTGRILDINRRGRNFTIISDGELSSIVRFNVSNDTRIFNRAGRPIDFSNLNQGMMVRVQHANFMTASIPPQTTAFEIRVYGVQRLNRDF